MALGRDPLDCTTLDPPPPQKGDNYTISDIHRLKIAIPVEFYQISISEDCKKKWYEAIRLLKNVGAHVEKVSLPHTRHSIACYHVLNESDVFSNMARYDSVRFGYRSGASSSYAHLVTQSRTEAFNSIVKKRIFAGNYFNLEEYVISLNSVMFLTTLFQEQGPLLRTSLQDPSFDSTGFREGF